MSDLAVIELGPFRLYNTDLTALCPAAANIRLSGEIANRFTCFYVVPLRQLSEKGFQATT
jgi:hypothetical protein